MVRRRSLVHADRRAAHILPACASVESVLVAVEKLVFEARPLLSIDLEPLALSERDSPHV